MSTPTPRPRAQHPLVLLALWATAAVLSWRLIGDRVMVGFIGIDPAETTYRGVVVAGVAILAAAVLTFRTVRRRLRERQARAAAADVAAAALPERRQFLVNGLAGTAAVVGAAATGGLGVVHAYGRWRQPIDEIFRAEVEKTAPRVLPAWRGARVKAYRTLGRTGAQVSDIALGTGAISGENGEAIARDAIERGVTYFDTAPDYSGADSEHAMGRAMLGHRDRMFVATKFCTPQGHLAAGSPVSAYMAAIEGSLQRLQTDHVYLVHIH